MPGYVVKITIEDTHPPVWRRVILPEGMTFYQLHQVIQIVFGWEDAHLHAFSFPNAQETVELPEAGGGYDAYPEKTVVIDEILKLTSWIRYTYDFGDDWRHKIVLEKEMLEYGERYATIIKSKGDSFIEDSGGWGEEQRKPFSPEAANARLQRHSFQKKSQNKKTTELLEALQFHQQWKEFEKAHKGNLFEAVREVFDSPQPEKSRIDKKAEKVDQFFEDKQAWEERNGKSRWLNLTEQEKNGKPYEQMTLPGIELRETPEEDAKKGGYVGYVFEKGQSNSTVAELLCGLNSKQTGEYIKYLQIENAQNCGRERQAELISETLRTHPEYLLYVFDGEEYCTLADLARMNDGPIQKEPDSRTLACAIALGLADIHVTHLSGKRGGKAVISPAVDACELLDSLGKTWKKELRRISQMEGRVKCCVLQYGLLEMDAFFDIYGNYWKDFAEKQEFYRFIYWHCSMTGLVRTITGSATGASYVTTAELDFVSIMEAQEKYAKNQFYRLPPKEELVWIGQNLAKRYVEWEIFGNFLAHVLRLGEEGVNLLIPDLYVGVISGMSVNELILQMLSIVHPTTLAERVELWSHMMAVCMDTDLAILKGYSRSSFSELTGIPACDIQLFHESKLKVKVGRNTHLWEFPAALQLRIYELYGMVERASRKPEIQVLMNEIGCDNSEVCWLFAEHYTMEGEFGKAEKMLGRIRKQDWDESVESLRDGILEARDLDDWGNEEGVFDIPDMDFPFGEDGFMNPVQPYRRETPKVGRNDPCPCGSGKKFKKCCGK